MSIEWIEKVAWEEKQIFQLGVELETSTRLVVKAGTFRYQSQDYTIDEDLYWDLPVPVTKEINVTGYVVLNKSTDVPDIFIDEMARDGSEEGYAFEDPDNEWGCVFTLFTFDLNDGVASLSGINIKAFKTKPAEFVKPPTPPAAPEEGGA